MLCNQFNFFKENLDSNQAKIWHLFRGEGFRQKRKSIRRLISHVSGSIRYKGDSSKKRCQQLQFPNRYRQNAHLSLLINKVTRSTRNYNSLKQQYKRRASFPNNNSIKKKQLSTISVALTP